MDKKEITKRALAEHYKKYPKLQVQDLLKYMFQSSFGCEHLIACPEAAEEYIKKEAEQWGTLTEAYTEPLAGDYCRVHLGYIREGLNPATLAKLFFLSAGHVEDGRERLEEKIAALMEAVEEGLLPFEKATMEETIEKWRKAGYPACHHSETFRAAYAPAYRLVKKEYAAFLPLFLRIDRMLQEGAVTLAVEGGSAAGKSTLGELLHKVYGCTVFHMDDFFLRPEQRTPERFAEPGGNVDRERFLEEVLLPVSKREPVVYRKFDCSTFTLKEPVTMLPTTLTVIEGAYSMHPELAEYYNLSVFLGTSDKEQKRRIEKRNTPEMAKRFFEEWIPMERKYVEAMSVKERCELVISR